MQDLVLVDREPAVATVTLNRPDHLNTLTRDMWARLGDTIRDLSTDDALRCVVLRGAGDRAFSAGNDIAEFATERSNAAQAKAYGAVMHGALGAIRDCRPPTLALIHGVCVGAGLEIAAMCDLRICGASSRFGAPINRLGLVMAYPEIAGLIELAGRAVALEILLEGRILDAAEAREKGLVTRVVADDRVEAEAAATVRRIADGAPLVARWHKKFARRLADPAPLTEAELDEGFACYDTQDFRTGCQSFLARTKPVFTGR